MAGVSRKGKKALLGRKVGMTQIFRETGEVIPVTVIEAGPCAVLQVRTEDRDGYSAYQMGFGDRRKDAVKPQQALFDKIGVGTKVYVRELPHVEVSDVLSLQPKPVAAEGADSAEEDGAEAAEPAEVEVPEGREVEPGDEIGVSVFRGVDKVDVQGVSKGRGFAGTIKRHNFQRGDAGHGSKNTREPGSTGQHTDPGRVFKGKRMAGHYGNARSKARNLEVVERDEEKNLLLVKGAVPGPNGGYLYIEESLV